MIGVEGAVDRLLNQVDVGLRASGAFYGARLINARTTAATSRFGGTVKARSGRLRDGGALTDLCVQVGDPTVDRALNLRRVTDAPGRHMDGMPVRCLIENSLSRSLAVARLSAVAGQARVDDRANVRFCGQ